MVQKTCVIYSHSHIRQTCKYCTRAVIHCAFMKMLFSIVKDVVLELGLHVHDCLHQIQHAFCCARTCIYSHTQRNALRHLCLIISYKGRLVFLSPQFKSCRKIQSSVHSVLYKCSRQVESHFIYSGNSFTKVIL